jgi:hypothetical protein
MAPADHFLLYHSEDACKHKTTCPCYHNSELMVMVAAGMRRNFLPSAAAVPAGYKEFLERGQAIQEEKKAASAAMRHGAQNPNSGGRRKRKAKK